MNAGHFTLSTTSYSTPIMILYMRQRTIFLYTSPPPILNEAREVARLSSGIIHPSTLLGYASPLSLHHVLRHRLFDCGIEMASVHRHCTFGGMNDKAVRPFSVYKYTYMCIVGTHLASITAGIQRCLEKLLLERELNDSSMFGKHLDYLAWFTGPTNLPTDQRHPYLIR